MYVDSGAGEKTTAVFWDAQWAIRDRREFRTWLLHGGTYGRTGTFLRMLRSRLGGVVLDGAQVVELGGANSRILVDLARWGGACVTAVDYSPVGVEATRAMFQREGVSGAVVLADVFDWKDGDGRFDIVTHWGVLEHFEDPRPLLAVAARLVKPGGIVAFSMPNLEAMTAALWRRLSPANFAAHVLHTDAAVFEACEASGLQLEQSFRFGMPCVRMAPLERGGVLKPLVNMAQAAILLVGRLAPVLARMTPYRLRSHRYFIARRKIDAPQA